MVVDGLQSCIPPGMSLPPRRSCQASCVPSRSRLQCVLSLDVDDVEVGLCCPALARLQRRWLAKLGVLHTHEALVARLHGGPGVPHDGVFPAARVDRHGGAGADVQLDVVGGVEVDAVDVAVELDRVTGLGLALRVLGVSALV